MIVRIKMATNNTGDITMLFGDSYKGWDEQFEEYIHKFSGTTTAVLGIEESSEDWVAWGGLKWCEEDAAQNLLNREGCQAGDPDNPNPRIYADFKFSPASASVTRKATKITGRWL